VTYISISQNFITDTARWQYNNAALNIENTTGHAYGWKAILPNGQRGSINIHGYSETRYGTDWRVLLTDLGPDGWKHFNPYNNDFTVCPILFVPADFYRAIDPVRRAAQTLLGNVRHSRDWYKKVLGKTFAVLDQVQLMICNAPSSYYVGLSELSNVEGHRFDYLNECRAQYETQVKRINPDIIYVASAYCGENPEFGAGAAAVSRFIMLPPNNCIIPINPLKYDLVNYAISHEIGHGLGLSHPAQDVPERKTYLMGGGVPPTAKFLDYEIEKLNASLFLK